MAGAVRTDRRLRLVSRLLLAFWCLLVLRAAQIQLLQHARWDREADIMRKDISRLPALRGEILSSDGQVLARSVLDWSLGVDPKMVKDPWALAMALDSLHLVQPQEFVREMAEHREERFRWISREILPETRLEPLLRRFNCLCAQTEGKRLYPFGRAGGPVVGMMGRDEAPLGGLESFFQDKLKGEDGKLLRISDATGKYFQGFRQQVLKAAVPGTNLEITLDSRLQEIAEARLRAAVEREGASAGFCILTRPATGEILAMSQVPGPDPADPTTWNGPTLKVRPVADCFEPGSSFKLVVFSAVCEAGLFNPEEPINCMGGRRSVPGGKPITDHEPYGVLKAWEVLSHSSNIGSGILAERAGAERFYRMEKAFGFGLPSGIQLPGEGRGRIPEPSSPAWSARSLVTMAFGQEVSCTALQMCMAYGAVANGGNLMRPLLVRALKRPDGSVLENWNPEVVRSVLRPKVASELQGLFRKVVTDGTGKKAEIPGVEPAGKTSTAQKFIPEEGAYSTRRYVAAFVGFAPYHDAQILCLVLLDEPTSSIYGGNVAAPLFREIVSDALPILGGEGPVPADTKIEFVRKEIDPRREVPEVRGLSAALGPRVLREAGFLPRLSGDGVRVIGVNPPAGERLLPGTVVTLLLGGGDDSASMESAAAQGPTHASEPEPIQRPGQDPTQKPAPFDTLNDASHPMPDLRGLCLRDALLRARSAGVNARIQGSGWVQNQTPEAGFEVAPGASCLLICGPDSCRAYEEYLQSERRAAWAASGGGLVVADPR